MSIQLVPSISESQSLVMGFGGIPTCYTMSMRKVLPKYIPDSVSYSVWSMLKGAIGKDLTKISMPIWLNEPISMLQKIGEVSKNCSIMDLAVQEKTDDFRRMALISIFFVSQYAEVYLRVRKPFNPILGETYEIIQPGYRYICEQVSHHPPVTAFHLDGLGYTLQGDTVVHGGLRGASLEYTTVGLNHLKLVDTDELILIKRPDTSAHNLIFGTLYVDVHGTVEFTNIKKNIKCVLNISRVGWTSANNYKVEGKVLDAN